MKSQLKYGLITGLSVCAWLFLSFTLLLHFSTGIPADKARTLSGLLGILILGIGLYLGIRATKNRNQGELSFKSAFLTGLQISFITAILVTLFSCLYNGVINPGFTEYMVKEAEKTYSGSTISPAALSEKLNSVRHDFSLQSQAIQAFAGQLVAGTLITTILSLILKTKTKK